MTADEVINITRLANRVDEMAKEMVTQTLLRTEVGRIDGAIEAHIKYTQLAAAQEAKRLDSIREVDATAVRVANDRAVEQAGILAKQVESVASTLRELVSTTATAAAETQAQLYAPLAAKLSKVEDKQNEDRGKALRDDPMLTDLAKKMDATIAALATGTGKASVVDPMFTELVKEMKIAATTLSEGKGKGAGVNSVFMFIAMAIAAIGGIIGIVHALGG